MDRILFSIPVHDRPDIVRDQIENINYFCPGSFICLHVAEGAAASRDEFARACDFENVVLNPHSLGFTLSDGLMHTHVSNFLHMLDTGLPFDKVVLVSSDEMLVKDGLGDYVSRYPLGVHAEVLDLATDWGVFNPELLQTAAMQGFLKTLGLPLFFGGQAEGQFFSKSIFGLLTKLFMENFPMKPCGFPTEQVIGPTMAARYFVTHTNGVPPVTLSNKSNTLVISNEVIAQVRSGKGTIFAKRRPGALRSPHIGASVLKGVFGVTHVPREDCDLRRHIRSLMIQDATR
ncbi:hypothetical protein C8J34_102756 [Rhizobium sp. PP-F2F-G36]|nr:hypothetical protein C8J34_102756 [Rhizobium sp. PP-F2F-G36]